MAYLGNSPGVASQRVVTTFTATAGQTVFTPQSGYTLGYCDVFLNGIKLVNGDDYTASNGTSITLASGAAAGDSVEVVAYFPRGLSDGYTKAETDARHVLKSGDTVTGAMTFDGATSRHIFRKPTTSGYHTVATLGTDAGGLHFVTDNAIIANGAYYANGAWNITNASATIVDWTSGAFVVQTAAGLTVGGTSSAPTPARLVVDQLGRVTMPYQPSFRAISNGTSSDSPVNNTFLGFSTISHNVGNCWNPTTKRFTAPVTGVYFFSVQAMGDAATVGRNMLRLYVNGGNAFFASGTTQNYGDIKISTDIRLNAGDYVEVYNAGGSWYSGTLEQQFSGHLIG